MTRLDRYGRLSQRNLIIHHKGSTLSDSKYAAEHVDSPIYT